MTHLPDEDDLEIVDSGHQVSTERTGSGVEEFEAIVENSGSDKEVTVKLQLCDEDEVLAHHERTHLVMAGNTQRYRFVEPAPPAFDQYVFTITDWRCSDND